MTVREALRMGIDEEMARDAKVFLMGEEVAQYQGAYKVSKGLLEKYGAQRVIDTPITEAGFAGLACGAAFAGLKPIVEFMTMNFSLQAVDHIVNSAAKNRYMSGGQLECPIVFRGPNGPPTGVGAQHSQCFAQLYSNIPGIKVVAPYSSEDAKGLIKAAIRDPDPVVVLESELGYNLSFPMSDEAMSPDFVVPIGKAKIEMEGSDVTIVSFSRALQVVLQATEALAKLGIKAEVINLRTLSPIDINTLVKSVSKTHRVVTVEEGWRTCGVGAEITALMMEHAFDQLDAPIERVTGAFIPMPYADSLERLAMINSDNVVNAVKRVCHGMN